MASPWSFRRRLSYKGMMYSDIPNLASAIGYTNASWTLKCELTAQYVCRLLNYMDRHGYGQCTPRRGDAPIAEQPLLDFSLRLCAARARPGCLARVQARPWKIYQNYVRDLLSMRFSRVADRAMEFRPRGECCQSEMLSGADHAQCPPALESGPACAGARRSPLPCPNLLQKPQPQRLARTNMACSVAAYGLFKRCRTR